MSQYRDHQYPQASPAASYPGTGADLSNPAGTPSSRMIAFSPAAGPLSASKILHTPDRVDGADNAHLLFSPTHSSGGGYRSAAASAADKDPFVTPSTKSKTVVQQLSANASGFRPFYDNLSSNGSDETQTRVSEELDKGRTMALGVQRDHISPALSTELHLSRCLELTSPAQAATTAEVEAYLAVGFLCHICLLCSHGFTNHNNTNRNLPHLGLPARAQSSSSPRTQRFMPASLIFVMLALPTATCTSAALAGLPTSSSPRNFYRSVIPLYL